MKVTFKSTVANFVLIKVSDTKRLCKLLADEGIYVRDRTSIPQLQGYVRMSVGTVDQTREVIQIFDKVLPRLPRSV